MPSSRRGAANPAQPWTLRPLVAALAAALPLWALAQGVPAPAPRTVPIPSASWRINGSGAARPVNTNNARGGVDQTINQTSQRAIYSWQSFDIGASSSVTFDMALPGGSALNRVNGSTAPSQIFGQLKATNNGEVYLINPNGILFGAGAQVNVGSLTASTLNLTDTEYLSGLTNSLASSGTLATFQYDGAPEDFIDSKNFVRVDSGASIQTTSGGRVFLFAKRVENDGAISTPDGQTVLAAGGQVFAELPTDRALYAAESNPAVPVLRGLLIEVAGGPSNSLPTGDGNGSVVNGSTGQIAAPRGNATLVGMAVNQAGRISATTSVSANGSIMLRAQQGDAQQLSLGGQIDDVQQGGALTLGPGSLTTVTPDETPGEASANSGQPATSTDNAGFIASRIDLVGKTIELQDNATVRAPGANVYLRAAEVPLTFADLQGGALAAGSPDVRIALDAGATIDVSGTTDATLSAARFFVTTDLLGSNDLKDAPVQKDGLLYRSKVTVDVRGSSPILGDLSGYRAALERTVDERLSAGGNVSILSEGAVVTAAGSHINLSGGQVTYTSALVNPTELLGSDGNLYSLNNAPANLVYQQGFNLQKSSLDSFDRWGVKVAYGAALPAQVALGYVQGAAAGQLSIAAPTVVLDGSLAAQTVSGLRQATGVDPLPGGGALTVGAVVNGGRDFASPSYAGALLGNFSLALTAPQVDASFWSDPLNAPLPLTSGMALGTIEGAGFTKVAVAADGAVELRASAAGGAGAGAGAPTPGSLALAPGGSLRLLSFGDAVTLGASVASAGGSVELNSRVADVQVADGAQVNLSGRWVNQSLGGPLDTTGTAGGSFSASGLGVTIGQGSVVDVSGGAVISTAGRFAGANAGSITLDDRSLGISPDTTLVLGGAPGGQLRGYSAAAGGQLSLSTEQVRIAESPDGSAGTLALTPDFFTQGGFGSFSVNGRLSNDVAAGTTLAPTRQAWQAPLNAALVPTGSVTADVVAAGLPPGVLPSPVNLTLSASGDSTLLSGELSIGAGALLNLTPQASVSLSAADRLRFDGQIVDHGGSVSMALGGTADPLRANWLWLGAGSSVDVSGSTLLTPTTNGLRQGSVLAGGTITLDSSGSGYASSLVLQQGARLDASGAADALDVTLQTTAGSRTVRAPVASSGGAITLASNRDLRIEGQLALQGGSSSVAGGALSVKLTAGQDSASPTGILAPRQLTVTQYPGATTAGLQPEDLGTAPELTGRAALSAEAVTDSGAADLSLSAIDSVRFYADTTLALPRNLLIQTRGISANPGTTVQVSAATISLVQAIPGTLPDGVSPQPAPVASAGTAALSFAAANGLVLDGQIATLGVGQLALHSGGDMRLQNSTLAGNVGNAGGLSTLADLTLSAQQLYPATESTFTFDAPGHAVTINGGSTGSATPLSAGGSLVVHAATIDQAGVLRAPLGSIELDASTKLTLASGSLTSVSADGLGLPYGSTSSGRWSDPAGQALATPPSKQVKLDAPDTQVQNGSVVNLGGGGDLLAYEFVPGPGGSTDIFASGSGNYAIVPGIQGLAPYDPGYASTARIGQQIQIGAGAPVPAGTYTLLPARYALQPGAFLVRPTTLASGLDLGVAIAQPDGSSVVGARLSDAGTGFAAALPSTWQVLPQAVARQYSEITTTSANSYFAANAAQAGSAVPALPADAGMLVVAAQQARLQGQFNFTAAPAANGQAAGRGGRAEFAAQQIEVDATDSGTTDGALHLSASTLNGLGAQSVILGATSGAAPVAADGSVGATPLNVVADSVSFQQGAAALTLPDLLAVSTQTVSVAPMSAFATPAGSDAVAPTAYAVQGDGAALRVSQAPGATLTRTGASQGSGALTIGAGSAFHAAAGSLTLDSSGSNNLAASVTLQAADLSLAANAVVVGGAPSQTVLALTPALAAEVSGADRLTLKAYTQIDLRDGAQLGSDALGQLVLDTPRLRALDATHAGAAITAGDITLTNSSGTQVGGAPDGVGLLSLHATTAAGGTGLLHFGDGALSFNGVGTLTMTADTAAALDGALQSFSPGAVNLAAPSVVAGTTAASLAFQTQGAFTLAKTSPASSLPASADGASLTVSAGSIAQRGLIDLPSGQVALDSAQGITLAAGASIDVAGRTTTLDGQAINQPGGSVELSASAGAVRLLPGSLIDVSGAGSGGRLTVSATAGAVSLQGALGGTAGNAADGARLSIDSRDAVDIGALAARLAPGTAADGTTLPGQFTGAVDLRQRAGDLTIDAGVTLAAQEINLEADGGALTVRGTLDASATAAQAAVAVGGSASGGQISLAARDTLLLAPGAQLKATGQSTAAAAGLATPMTAAGAGAGGQVELFSSQGSLDLAVGATIDVSAAAGAVQGFATEATGGRVLLRAPRTGISDTLPAGSGVAIDTIGADVRGASRVDVEAVKTYALGTDATGTSHIADFVFDPDTLAYTVATSTIAQDSANWVGNLGQNAESLAQTLAGGNATLLDSLRVHAAADITSTGNLQLDTFSEWTLPADRANLAFTPGAVTTHLGDTSVSLRAAGNLVVPQGISSGVGFIPSSASGSLRLTGGADLAAASPGATLTGAGGDVVIGNTGPVYANQVGLRTTTGSIDIAAAGDINLRQGRVSVVTLGVPSDDDAAVAARQAGIFYDQAFRTGGGSIRLQAGGSVFGRASELSPYLSLLSPTQPSLWMESGLLPPPYLSTTETAYWTGNDLFDLGLATFGGGDIQVRAGLDVRNLVAAAPTSGNWSRTVGGSAGTVQRYGGGSLRVEAGRDVVNGEFDAGGSLLDVRAGRDIAYTPTPGIDASPGLYAVYENTAVTLEAGRAATIGNVQSLFALNGQWLSGLDGDASARLQAAAGDLTFRTDAEVSAFGLDAPLMLLPAQLQMLAPNGSLAIEASAFAITPLVQQPRDAASFDLLAAQALTIDQPVQINATRGSANPPDFFNSLSGDIDSAVSALQLGELVRSDGNLPDASSRAPVELVAAGGDLTLTTSFETARPLRALAGRDLTLSLDSGNGLVVQQQNVRYDSQGVAQPVSELSLLQAGRDIQLNNSGVNIDGPGDLVLLAGRDVDLGTGNVGLSGVVANGNQNNTLLPAQGASISVVAGFSATAADYTAAVSRGFQALGATVLTQHAGDVYAWLSAGGSGTPVLGSAVAAGFDALALDNQLASVRSLLGIAAYNQALATFVRSQPGQAGLNDTQALAAFASLSDGARSTAPGVLLAGALGMQPQASRVAFVSTLAQADATATASGLVGFMAQVTGQTLSLADAITGFETLPVERQLTWLDQVLVDDVRANGRIAAAASGSAKDTAYALGYDAIASIFPAEPTGPRPVGNLLLPNAQVKTLQPADITLMVPGGSVNAGGVAASTTSPNDLGVVTVAGGNISAITQGDFQVNQSRVFTLGQGDVLLWSSLGDIDAGRGAKTLVGAPAPVLRLDQTTGRLFLDTSGSFTGSGIAVLDAGSTLDLYAPTGAIDAGEAGIKAAGNVFLGATVVRGADNLSIGGTGVGAPPPVATVGVTAGLANAGNAAAAATRTDSGDDEDDKRRKRRARRNLLLEFLGFGSKS